MKSMLLFIAPALVAHLMVPPAAAIGTDADAQRDAIDLTGRWALNADLSDPMAAGAPPQGEPGREGRPPGERGGGPGGGAPGGAFPGGGGPGGPGGGRRPNPEDMARMRDAIQAVLDAPAEMIVTGHDDEVVFTSASGDVTRILVTGTKMKTTAGGAEHEVKASYRDGTLIVESFFGEMKVVDTYRLVGDGARLERVTEFSGGPRRPGGGKPKPRRLVYDRTGTERNQALSGSIPSGAL